ncbi:hypothetical protein VNI00_001248 [Paramarasmius palmivorus]|uniref:C2H2-type domain-containing protein n=1 Tax=Paramarasmius palmivorus TaxID=297713 RepID=A0AAW0E5K3_9AGAR
MAPSLPFICRWGFCREIFYSDDEYTYHLIYDHVRKTQPEPLSKQDLDLMRRAEDGVGRSFSTDGLMYSYSQEESGRKYTSNSQESLGAASLPSPPDTAPKAFSHSPSPSPGDELERSYRSVSPSAPASPVSEKASPFLFISEEENVPPSPNDKYIPLEDRSWSTTRYATPTFAALSSSPIGSPRLAFHDIPSPSLSSMIENGGRGTKRKRTGDDEEEASQDSSSSSNSRRQVEEELTQSLGLEDDDYVHPFDQPDPVESHDSVHPAEQHSTDVSNTSSSLPLRPLNETTDTIETDFSVCTRDKNRRADTPPISQELYHLNNASGATHRDTSSLDNPNALPEHTPSSPTSPSIHAGPSAPLPKRASIYQEPRFVESPYRVPSTQTWYMSKRKKSRGSNCSSAVSLQNSPIRDSFTPADLLGHTQVQHSPPLESQDYAGDAFPFLSQAPYFSQTFSR